MIICIPTQRSHLSYFLWKTAIFIDFQWFLTVSTERFQYFLIPRFPPIYWTIGSEVDFSEVLRDFCVVREVLKMIHKYCNEAMKHPVFDHTHHQLRSLKSHLRDTFLLITAKNQTKLWKIDVQFIKFVCYLVFIC